MVTPIENSTDEQLSEQSIAALLATVPEQWFDISKLDSFAADHRINRRPDADWAEFGHCATVSANYAAFIAAAPAAIRYLIAQLKEARAEIERLQLVAPR